jgi:hypothetical protein
MKLKINTWIFSGLLLAIVAFQSCGFYSFSGTSIPQEVKTFSVSYFENNAPINSPLLSQTITEGLKQKFISETNLSIEEQNGDFDFSGEITSFTVTPVSAQSTDNAQLNRLTYPGYQSSWCVPQMIKYHLNKPFQTFKILMQL